MYRNKKTRRKLNKKYGGNPPCSTPLETNDKCKWGATKRRCMRLAIDSTPQIGDKSQTNKGSLPKSIIISDKEYPSIIDKIIAENPNPIYRVIPIRAYPLTTELCPPDIYMTDYSSRGIDTCIANPKTQWPCDCPPDWYHARIDGTFICMNPLRLTPVYLKHKPDAPPDKIRVTIYDDENYKKINRVATLDKLTNNNNDTQPEMDYVEYYEPTTARPEPVKPKIDTDDTDKDVEDVEDVKSQSNVYQWSKERMKQKYSNIRKSVKNVMRPLADKASKLKKNISKRISSVASSISSISTMSLEKMAAAAVTKRDIASSKLRQEGLLYERRKDMNIEDTNPASEFVNKKTEPLNSWVNKQTNKLGVKADKLGSFFDKKLNKLGINTDRCSYGKNKSVLTDMIIKLVLEIKSQDVDTSEYEKITRKIVDDYEDAHPYLYWTTVLYHRFHPYLILSPVDDISYADTIKYINSLPTKWQVVKKDITDSITILYKKTVGDIPVTITKQLFLLGNDLIVSALNNDIQYLNLPFPHSSVEIVTDFPVKSYIIPRSLPRTARFNISANVEDMNSNCGIYEEFTEKGMKIIKASIPSDCYKDSKDPKCMTVLNDIFFKKIASDTTNELCMDFWRLCIAYRIHFNYILNSKFAHEVANRLLKRRITSLLVALAHYSSGETLDIERIGPMNIYRADNPP